jgi:response regulator RpfG family c-di-GMP phosphodiesterase
LTVVDDEAVARDVLVRAAELWGYECQAADTAEAALAVLERRPTPLVVTDLRMPGKGGVWLVREIRRRWPDMAIIVVTAGEEDDSVGDCLRAGAHHYFLKPVKLDEFRHVLEVGWRSYRLERDNRRYRRRLEHKVCRQTHLLRQTYLSAIDSLVRAMEERDPYTAGHSSRVHRYAMRLGRRLDLDRRTLKRLSLAARLHDIGKVGVPEEVLNKPGPLTGVEDLLIREHPIIGERIVAPIVRNPDVLAAIRGHHERLDGSGYPDGLAGDRIPLLARVIAIADCFDALTSLRAYRRPLPAPEALNVLLAGAGAQFQADFVQAFVEAQPVLMAD